MATLPLVLGIAAIVAVPTVAFVMTNEYHSLDGEGCAVVETEAYTGSDARTVQIRIINKAEAATLRLCVQENDGPERHQEEVELAADSVHTISVKVAPHTKRVALEIDRPGYEYTDPVYVITGASWTLPTCTTQETDLPVETEFHGNGSAVWSKKATCMDG